MGAERAARWALGVVRANAPTPAPGAGGSGHTAVTFWTVFGAVAGALGLAGVAALSVKQLITPSLKRAGTSAADVLYDYLAVLRSRSLRRIRRYQRSVGEYAREHTLGFGTEPISVRDVYVPLAAEGTGERRDLYEAIRKERRSVVIGEAGAGKSMLLKHSLLEWAERHTNRRSEIPVLVELRRLNSVPADAVDLVAQVQRFLETHRFKGAAGFVTKALEDGRISVLFDGLDEVTADRLDDVVQKLKDFAERFGDCQIVVTCRSSLYKGDLEFKTVVRVAELDDATIRRLLHRWPGLDAASEERLYRNLGSTPTLKRLARSPLLLSMMAWMTTSGIVLPTSRAEFYDTAIENLVKRDDVLKRGRSRFAANKKLVVLRGIALILQDRSGTDKDRLNISHTHALEYIRSIAAAIDLDEKDAEPLLAEIVDRSELLATNGGVVPSYFFRHLTFQEYLAAVELRDDRDGILARYVKDRNAWRETVKLWCGRADRDAEPLIKFLLTNNSRVERMMALECASVTTRLDEAVVVEVVDTLQEAMVSDDVAIHGDVAAAFGQAAAGDGPRSSLIRERLFALARSRGDRRQNAALLALGYSSHVSAAEFLVAEFPSRHGLPYASLAMRMLGDLTVPALCSRAVDGEVSAVEDLASIGTPIAIEALVKTLFRDHDAAVRAAWRLAERLGDAVAVETISNCPPLPGPDANRWVWERFSGESRVLSAVVGRLFELIDTCEVDQIPTTLRGIDFRLAVASIVVDHDGPGLRTVPDVIAKQSEAVLQEVRHHTVSPVAKTRVVAALNALQSQESMTPSGLFLVRDLLDHYRLSPHQAAIFKALSWPDRLRILTLLTTAHRRSEWTAMPLTTPGKPRSRRWFIGLASIAAIWFVAVGLRAEFLIAKGAWEFGSPWVAVTSLASLLGIPLAFAVGLLPVRPKAQATLIAVMIVISVIFVPYHLVVVGGVTADLIGVDLTLALLIAVGLPLTLLGLHSRRANRRYNNPLRQAIEASGATARTTSIIA